MHHAGMSTKHLRRLQRRRPKSGLDYYGGSVRAAVQPICNALRQPCLTGLIQPGRHWQAEQALARVDEPKRVDSIGALMDRPVGA